MSSKPYDPSLVTIPNNPFFNTNSVSITPGIYHRSFEVSEEIQKKLSGRYMMNTQRAVKLSLLVNLQDRIQTACSSNRPVRLLVLAEYGLGKSFSLKEAQDEIYSKHGGALISHPLGGVVDSEDLTKTSFPVFIVKELHKLFDNLIETDYPLKETVREKYGLGQKKPYHDSLIAYDKAFEELGLMVFLILDELDKIVTSPELSDGIIKKFLEDVRLIGDNCSGAISLIVAGTPNCKKRMDEISPDYAQRYDRLPLNQLSYSQVRVYIQQKCKPIVGFVSKIPFTTGVVTSIYKFSGGNTRKIERMCRLLWRYAAKNKCKLDKVRYNEYLTSILFEEVKTLIPEPYSGEDFILKYVTNIFLNGGRMGMTKTRQNFIPKSKLKLFEEFIEDAEVVKVVDRSYKLTSSFEEALFDILLNY